MLSQLASTLGLFTSRVLRLVRAAVAIEVHVSPELTIVTVVQSCPTMPRQRTSLTKRLSQFASIKPLLTLASWKLLSKNSERNGIYSEEEGLT